MGSDEAPSPANEIVSEPFSPAAGSVLATIRARRDQLAGEKSLTIDVPGYEGLLALKMGVVATRQLQGIGERSERSNSPDAATNGNVDVVIAGLVDVLARGSVDDQLAPIDDAGAASVNRLGELLGLDVTSARATMIALFSGAPSPDLAIGAAAAEYIEWLRGENQEVDEALLGES
jgi:hypothetical protein